MSRPAPAWPWMAYNAALGALLPVWAPYALWRFTRGKSRVGRRERLGRLPPLPPSARRVWLHGASVGEMMALRPIAERFHARHPDAPVVVSTITATGQEIARKAFGWAEQVRYFPLDLPGPVARSVGGVGPRVTALVETELWPNFIHAAAACGPVVMLNGRLSDKTFGPARRVRPLYAWMLGHLSAIGAQTEADAERFISLGAPEARVRVMGTSKFDEDVPTLDDAGRRAWRRTLGLGAHRALIAGSTFPGEDEAVLDAFLHARPHIPDLRLLIAPRHIKRAGDVARAAEERGLRVARRSLGPASGEDVIIVDTYGELATLYGLADAAFIGRSLTERGGQNLIQPMAHGVPVVYGPHMQNFRDVAAQAESAGAAIRASDAAALTQALTAILTSDDIRRTMGAAGKRLVAANRGASDRYAALLSDALEGRLGPEAAP